MRTHEPWVFEADMVQTRSQSRSASASGTFSHARELRAAVSNPLPAPVPGDALSPISENGSASRTLGSQDTFSTEVPPTAYGSTDSDGSEPADVHIRVQHEFGFGDDPRDRPRTRIWRPLTWHIAMAALDVAVLVCVGLAGMVLYSNAFEGDEAGPIGDNTCAAEDADVEDAIKSCLLF